MYMSPDTTRNQQLVLSQQGLLGGSGCCPDALPLGRLRTDELSPEKRRLAAVAATAAAKRMGRAGNTGGSSPTAAGEAAPQLTRTASERRLPAGGAAVAAAVGGACALPGGTSGRGAVLTGQHLGEVRGCLSVCSAGQCHERLVHAAQDCGPAASGTPDQALPGRPATARAKGSDSARL